MGRPASECSSPHQQRNVEVEQREEMRKEGQLTTRRIRAPKGEGMSSLMASLTSSPRIGSHSTSCCSPSLEINTLPRPASTSSLNSEASCNSVSYRTLSASSSCYQVSLGEVSFSKTLGEPLSHQCNPNISSRTQQCYAMLESVFFISKFLICH